MMREQVLVTPRIVEERDLDLTRPRPVANPPVWKAISDDLRGRLLNGAWSYGERIASERQLAADYGVARPTIREAIRALTGEGLLEIQRSNAGGALVRWPSRWSEEEIRERLRRNLPEILDLLDIRVANEPFAARQAALKRTQKLLDAMHDAVQAMKAASKKLEDLEKQIAEPNLSLSAKEAVRKEMDGARLEYRRGDAMFHLAVAVAAGNPFLLETIERSRTEFFTALAADLLARSTDRRSAVIKHHKRILENITESEDHKAAEAMREHIESTKKDLSKLLENDLESRIASNEEETASADEVRNLLSETQVFVLGQNESVNAEHVAAEHDIFRFDSEGTDGRKQTIVPVFTRSDFVQDAIDRNRDWQQYLPVQEVIGSELLSELEPQLTVVINPCSPHMKFELPVAGVQTVRHAATA